jgi:dienelactone hydrolase
MEKQTDIGRRRASGAGWVVGRAILLLACTVLAPASARAQSSAPATPHILMERVTAPGDSSHSSAIHLPADYSASRRWPALFVLDPRGRAMPSLERFIDAADRLGYIVVSSYDSRSDSSTDVNVQAINAMFATAMRRFTVDTTRMYLAGFSGTARQIWDFAAELPVNIAGVIGFGAGLPNLNDNFGAAFEGREAFAFFGGAGVDDFNFIEAKVFAEKVKGTVASRFAEYGGGHAWPSAELCGAALEWMHSRAMLGGRIAVDSAFVLGRIKVEMDSARTLEARAQLAKAAAAYQRIADDYPGWPGVAEAKARSTALTSNPAVHDYFAWTGTLADAEQRQEMELERALVLARLHSLTAEQLLEGLDVQALKERAASGDSLQAPTARRLLARVQVAFAFYEPRDHLARGNGRDALELLEAANRIAPLNGESCAMLARAHTLAPKVRPELQCGGVGVPSERSESRDPHVPSGER